MKKKNFLKKKSLLLTTSVIICLGLYLGYRLPIRFMLAQLGMLSYYPLSSLVITLLALIITANIKMEQVKPIQIYLAIFFAFSATFLISYVSAYYHDICVFIIMLPSQLQHIIEILDNRIKMGYSGTTYYCSQDNRSHGGV